MKIHILAVGLIKPGPEKELITTYTRRCRWTVDIEEISPSKGQNKPAEEARLIRTRLARSTFLIALDSQGQQQTSSGFTTILHHGYQQRGHCTFIIGGADGLSADLIKQADKSLSFGQNTWPHKLARVMLCEQLYRAEQITTGHPYHQGH